MSHDDPSAFDLDEAEFDPDPFGFDKPPRPTPKSRRSEPHNASDRGKQDELDLSGSVLERSDSRGTSKSTEGHSCFSVPNPWPDTHRAAPSEFLRCRLYRPMQRGRELLAMKRLDTNANVQLCVSGPELSEFDLDTWLTVVHLLRCGPAELTRWSLIAASPRARGAQGSNAHRASLQRLQKVELVLDVQNERSREHPEKEPDSYHFEGRLIDRVEWQEFSDPPRRKHRNERVQIALSPALSVLFERKRRTILIPSHRAAIGDNPVALWFYGVIRSHSPVLPRPLLYYHRMSGSGSSPPDFARQVKRALSLLAERRIIYSAELRRGMLFIQRQRPAIPRNLPVEDTEWYVLAGREKSA